MEAINDLANEIPFLLISSLFGLWFFAWILGFVSAHLLRSVFDMFYRSVDD
ncbi:TPA: hypothetical protein G9F26_003959 [Salmonella enterica]|uniref:Uncharacterized protein n=1 Tax=Salmonella enterica TaxID=28901 RepID=A0A750I0U9_SALER|nr:hypothetical protein [Salmonella enterica]